MDIREVRKQTPYGNEVCPSHFQSQSSVGDLGVVTGIDGQRSSKMDKRGKSDDRIHYGANYVCVCVCGSAPGSGCFVDSGTTTSAILSMRKRSKYLHARTHFVVECGANMVSVFSLAQLHC